MSIYNIKKNNNYILRSILAYGKYTKQSVIGYGWCKHARRKNEIPGFSFGI